VLRKAKVQERRTEIRRGMTIPYLRKDPIRKKDREKKGKRNFIPALRKQRKVGTEKFNTERKRRSGNRTLGELTLWTRREFLLIWKKDRDLPPEDFFLAPPGH